MTPFEVLLNAAPVLGAAVLAGMTARVAAKQRLIDRRLGDLAADIRTTRDVLAPLVVEVNAQARRTRKAQAWIERAEQARQRYYGIEGTVLHSTRSEDGACEGR